jgi:tetratricopeptide (TPR) repeat protein
MTIRGLLFTLGCCALLIGPIGRERARAQAGETGDVDAGRSHFDRGVEYVQDGDLRAALIEFKRAYLASPNYRVLYNLGQVCNELREYTEAQRYFESYLSDGADEIQPARKREVEALLAKLSGRIATLVLSSNVAGAELFVDDVSVGKSPLTGPVRVSTGTRRVSAAISGRPRITRVVEAAGGDTLPVRLEFAPNPADAAHSVQNSAPDSNRKSDGAGPVLWLGISTGVLAVGAGVMSYLAARDSANYQDAVRRKTTPQELDQLDNSATTKALVADILLGATVVAGAATLVFALKDNGTRETESNRNHRASAHLTIGVGALSLSGGF